MSEFELKYLKEVLENLKVIRQDKRYTYIFDETIEKLIELIEEYE